MANSTKKTLIAASVATLLIGISTAASACSRLIWKTDEHGVFVSRTMDWMEENQPTIDVRPKGQSYVGAKGENAIRWTSKYASMGVSIYGVGLVDGFNEAGFAANALFLDEETVGTLDSSKRQLENTRIIAYFLDNFATVEAAIKNIDQIQIQQFNHNGMALKGHYSLQDASGDSAILQFINGQWQIHHGEQYDVMTNSPEYAKHLENWEKAKPTAQSDYNAKFELPGNIESSQRFVWNKYMKSQLTEPSSYTNGLAKLDSVTYKIPLDAANRELNGVMTPYATIYGLVYNLDQKVMNVRYQYGESYTHFSVDFNKVNNGKNYTIEADRPDLFGDVTALMTPSTGVMAQYRTDR
ncbi:linear amide C-N hydrolase [Vibrio vulnificus]|uniref:linear amide C-N hydrolase n=1 Tax=Vibrio vulnificus TaxID=672 RepID=UPI001028C733|nr:linear amide C-N hydrolase [Vibrio vulnificus]EHU9443360.1 linear amide C-N hydrolase [Vibrio vulnificus]EIY8040244.1 linear amide C-N hydrolase [Vibrio vulnificus]EIY8044594.1 linear amide C-N hydrolase [Vibrio vulnificus]RZP99191.1 linear amide C-N hydrolase [Vibrio vulnificus]